MIRYKTKEEIELLREGGKILAGVLREVSAMVAPGVKTSDLEALACRLISKAGGRPAFLGFPMTDDGLKFPTALCTSINNEVVHGPAIPGRELVEGDIISIDIGMEYPFEVGKSGLYTDMAVTLPVGKVNPLAEKLMTVTKESLRLAIANVKPGVKMNVIGGAIQRYVEANGFSVVRDLVGHGVGHAVHEEPQVPHFTVKNNSKDNITLKEGLVIAIEPMVNVGNWAVRYAPDRMTIRTADGSLSAHFEHTVAVVKGGHVVITE